MGLLGIGKGLKKVLVGLVEKDMEKIADGSIQVAKNVLRIFILGQNDEGSDDE